MGTKQIIIHIGLHKTGTSFLQKSFFNQLTEIEYIHGTLGLRRLWKHNDAEVLLISDESISSNLWAGDYTNDFYKRMNRLKSLFGANIKIIVGFRMPMEFIKSIYKQYLHEGGTMTFSDFFNLAGNGIIKIEDLFFSEKLDFLKETFNDVFVYEQKSLKNNFEEFAVQIKKFIGAQELLNSGNSNKRSNIGIKSTFQFALLRFLNRFGSKKRVRVLNALNLGGLSFRNICQNYLRFIPSKPYVFPEKIMHEIESKTQNDWQEVIDQLSY